MEQLYVAGVGMMLFSLPGIGKTEMIRKESHKLLTKYLGSEKAADDAFFIVDMSGIPAESLSIPYIDQGQTPEQQRINLMNIIASSSGAKAGTAQAMAAEKASKMLEELEAHLASGIKDKRLQRDVIGEIRDAINWVTTHDKGRAVVFIDEITSANQDDQRTLMNFIQSGISPDGTVVDLDRIWFILAGNPSNEMPGYEDYDGATNPVEEAVITRVATFFVKADVNDVLEWGAQSNAQGDSNLHPYLTAALETDRSLYMRRDPGDIRLMNSRTLFKLSEYFKASTKLGMGWSGEVVNSLIGEKSGAALADVIKRLDKTVSLKDLFGSSKDKELNPTALAKFKASQAFEKYYVLSLALDESSPLDVGENTMRKLVQLIDEGDVPSEAINSLASRVIHAPKGSKISKMTQGKYILNKEFSLLYKFEQQRRFASGGGFQKYNV